MVQEKVYKLVNNKVWVDITNIRKKHSTFDNQKKIRDMKIFSKEMLINAGITLAVVMVGLYVHDKFVAPKLASGGSSDAEA
jgi:hypothetical protein